MTPFDLLVAIDAALATPGRRPLELTAPVVLGQRGRLVVDDRPGRPRYGYTRRQCRQMQALIRQAALDDLGGG